MKKVVSVLLALVLIFALFACSSTTTGTSPSASSSAPASASTSPSAPASSAAPSSAAPSASASAAAPSKAGSSDLTKSADKIGFFTDGVDPASRKTYNIIHMYPMTLLLYQKMTQCYNDFGKKLNIKVTPSTTENDMDKFVQQIQTYASQGNVDGFLMVIDAATSPRIVEVLNETKIPWIGWCNSVRDDKGVEVAPAVGLDQKAASAKTVQWLADNYKKYWGDKVDPSTIALMDLSTSINVDLKNRGVAAVDTFKKLFPKNGGVYARDLLTDFTQDAAYNEASATFSAHPEIKYWFVTNCFEMYAQGAARAVESIGLSNKVLITDVGSDILCSEWQTNYDGAWKSCLAISNYLYAAPSVCGLVALIDGKATWDTLWTDKKDPADKYAFYGADSTMITKDTYKDYFNSYCKLAGAPLEYPN